MSVPVLKNFQFLFPSCITIIFYYCRTKIFYHFQEYPPGVVLVPMGSRTAKPFHTTNLVVFAPEDVPGDSGDKSFFIHGDALIVDPGCHSKFHGEVWHISL